MTRSIRIIQQGADFLFFLSSPFVLKQTLNSDFPSVFYPENSPPSTSQPYMCNV